MRSRIESQFEGVLDSLISVGVGLAEAIVVIVIARYLHHFVRDRILRRFDSPNLSESGRTVIGILTTIVFVIVTGTLLLALWGVTWSGIVAAISLGTLGILLGIQDVLKSLIGGIFLILERPYSIGDRISVRDVTGRVIGIDLRTTIIRSDDGHRIVAPNSIVFTDTLTNYSERRQIRTSLVIAGVSGSPAELHEAIESAISSVEGVAGPVEVRVKLRSTKVRAPAREKYSSSPAEKHTSAAVVEVWVSWLGGGEPEVQAEVLDRLKTLYPNANVRARAVRGTVVPRTGSTEHNNGR